MMWRKVRSEASLALALSVLAVACEFGEGEKDLPPELAAEYRVVSHTLGFDCDNPGEEWSEPYEFFEVEQLSEGKRAEIRPCGGGFDESCDSLFGHSGGLYYVGDSRWTAISRTAYTSRTSTCRVERMETAADLRDDGSLRIRVQAYAADFDYVPLLNPCESEKADSDLPCERHVLIEAVPVE